MNLFKKSKSKETEEEQRVGNSHETPEESRGGISLGNLAKVATEKSQGLAKAAVEKGNEMIQSTIQEVQSLNPVLNDCGYIIGDIVNIGSNML